MIKRKFTRVELRGGESLSRMDFPEYTICVLVTKGKVMVFDCAGKVIFCLEAGDVNIFTAKHEFTGTAVEDGTELIFV